ncbi:30S ribosomal protein S20 [Candidatus Daviesbacteria bacterium]|nr:30S ribosomal protein S20 [Candidatus Daviesbacteria bacterium]
MPVIKSAIKKVRKDKVRTARNKKRETTLKSLIKKARVLQTSESLQAAYSALDKAAKVHLIHPNKSARLKSRLAKLMSYPSFTSESKAARLKSRLSKGVKGDRQLTPIP